MRRPPRSTLTDTLFPHPTRSRSHALDVETWVDAGLATRVRRSIDGRGLPRSDDWVAGHGDPVPLIGLGADVPASDVLGDVLKKAEANESFTESDIVEIGRGSGRESVGQ